MATTNTLVYFDNLFHAVSLALIISVLSMGPSLRCEAKETDQYTDRQVLLSLVDSSAVVDTHINQLISQANDELNRRAPIGVDVQWSIIENTFQSNILPHLLNPIEDWASDQAPLQRYVVAFRGIYGQSVDYDDMFLGWPVNLSPTIKLAGVLMGTDKIGHFFGQGWEYLQHFRSITHDRNDLSSEALEGAYAELRRKGDELERGNLGTDNIGVYSAGDLAANWQGFTFYRNIFNGPNPYITLGPDGRYYKQNYFTFSNYVADDFDEALNPSRLRSQRFFNKVRSHFVEGPNSICSAYQKEPALYRHTTAQRLDPKTYLADTTQVHSEFDARPRTSQLFIDITEICRSHP